jgi:hypothetical protein
LQANPLLGVRSSGCGQCRGRTGLHLRGAGGPGLPGAAQGTAGERLVARFLRTLGGRWHLLGVLLLAACAPLSPRYARAQEAPDGPKRIFQDEFIDRLAGDWKLTRKIRGTQVENTVKAEWVLNHQFLQLHMKDVAVPPAYEALILIGYSHADQQYVAPWCDTYGGRISADGYGKRSGDTIEFEFHHPDGPFFNTFT